MADHTPYQQKIIKRYYRNFDSIKSQRLADLTAEIYLSEGKKRDRLWKQVGDCSHPTRVPRLPDRTPLAEARPGRSYPASSVNSKPGVDAAHDPVGQFHSPLRRCDATPRRSTRSA